MHTLKREIVLSFEQHDEFFKGKRSGLLHEFIDVHVFNKLRGFGSIFLNDYFDINGLCLKYDYSFA